MADRGRHSDVGELAQGLLDLLFPPRCVACGAHGAVFCAACLAQARAPAEPLCLRCGMPTLATPRADTPTRCAECIAGQGPLALTGLRLAAYHEGSVRKAVHALKYTGRRRAAQPLADLLAMAYHRYHDAGMVADLILPVPLHRDRARERGYNQSALLARALAKRLRLPMRADLLIRARATQAQVGLSRQARRANVANAFALARPDAARLLAGKRILLVDDVATTGSTLDAAAQALLAAAPATIWGLTVTRPMRHAPDDL